MNFHRSGWVNVPGTLIVVVALADASQILPYILVPLFVCFVCFILISSTVAAKRLKQTGLSPDQLLKAAQQLASEQLHEAAQQWSLPPELNLPPPRPVRSAPLGTRLLRTLPRIFRPGLAILFIYAIVVTIMTNRNPRELPSLVLHAFLDFLHAPRWQGWMLWPSLIFGGVAGFIVLSGHFQRRKEKRLLKWGNPARAAVTAISSSTSGAGRTSGSISYTWTLAYSDAAGKRVRGYLNRNAEPRPDQLALTVLYDPDKPHQFIVYPVAQFKIAVPENS
jgi:TRAP-type C4-dicarboxylate transport system permease small subunit